MPLRKLGTIETAATGASRQAAKRKAKAMAQTHAPRNSPSDLKEYRLLTLANGLEVLLVSSKELKRVRGVELSTCKAAAGLCVQAGSLSSFCISVQHSIHLVSWTSG